MHWAHFNQVVRKIYCLLVCFGFEIQTFLFSVFQRKSQKIRRVICCLPKSLWLLAWCRRAVCSLLCSTQSFVWMPPSAYLRSSMFLCTSARTSFLWRILVWMVTGIGVTKLRWPFFFFLSMMRTRWAWIFYSRLPCRHSNRFPTRTPIMRRKSPGRHRLRGSKILHRRSPVLRL